MISESLLQDTRNFQTKHLLEAKALYESRLPEVDEVEHARHLATLEVLRERIELGETMSKDNIALNLSGPETIVLIKALGHFSGFLCDEAEKLPNASLCADIEIASELLGRMYPLLAQKASEDMLAIKSRWN
jgi:hypothetical protein